MYLRSLLLLGVLASAAAPLFAQDDRDRTTPVGAIWAPGQSTAQLQTLVNQGWRFTDLEIESTAPFAFTVSAVENSGSYAKAWWYGIGIDASQLGAALAQNNGRLVDLEPYESGGTTRFAAIWIANVGVDAKSWWWGYDMSSAQVDASVSANNARLTSLERTTRGGTTLFAAVMISNTGADLRAWGYLYGVTQAQLEQNLAQYGNRIYGIERVAADSYDAILIRAGSTRNWHAFDLGGADLTELLQQNIGRLVDVERHATLLGPRYTAVLLDNANAVEILARSRFLSAPANARGDYGFFLQELNGPVLAQMRPDTVFEPGSTMKTLYHVHAMKQVANGLPLARTMVEKPAACGLPGPLQSLELTLREMMEYSDNMSTLAISNRFGLANIEATAGALGMSSTRLNFTIGCSGPSPENELTLRDLARLHQEVANGYLGAQRATFYELMAESLSFPSWGTDSLSGRIDSHSLLLGLPANVRDAFKAELHIAYKPGGVAYNGTYYFAEGGWISVPWKNPSGAITRREYLFGAFNYRFFANEVAGRDAMGNAELELVWNRVSAALATWDNFQAGSFTSIGAGCAGSAGVPVHTASGNPEIGNNPVYELAGAPAFAGTILAFGLSSSSWGALVLPLDLAFLGAPGCVLRTEPLVSFFGPAHSNGSRASRLGIPNDPLLIDLVFYSQYHVLDPAANPLGLTLSNAIRTQVGGWR